MADYRRNPYNRQSCGCQQEPAHAPVGQSPAGASCSVSLPSDNRSCDKAYDMERFPIAMLYVPWQKWNQTYELDRGLKTGTIFPDLDRPFRGIRKGGCKK